MSQLSRNVVRIAVVAILSLGCRGTAPEPPEACLGSIQLGLRYEPLAFDWSPRCGISTLTVTTVPATPGEAEQLVWAFNVPEQSPVGPAVAYGEAPSRANVWAGPEPLVIGKRYRVTVRYIVGGDGVAASGELTFPWFPPD